MTSTRSKFSAQKSMSCVIATTVRPSACSSATTSPISATPRASCPVVGSSSTTIGVSMASTDASATRFRSLSDRWYGCVSSMPGEARRASSERVTRSGISSFGTPRFLGPNAISSRMLRANSCSSGFWKTYPTRVASAAMSRPFGVPVADLHGARRRLEDAVEVTHERGLARAVLPDDREPLAGGDGDGHAVSAVTPEG